MEKPSLITIFSSFGILLGNGIIYSTGQYNIMWSALVSSFLSTLFSLVALKLNEKGLLFSVFQVIDLLVGFLLFYLLFYIITALAIKDLGLEDLVRELVTSLIAVPVALFMIIRHIKKKNIKLQRIKVEED
ncbi:hypothetical protein [Paenibacillus dendritiformis]|uniref:Uncharacterized protein n=1 Tax=Paenibacillus dendritiformis C454 TaxID=1131935 RepID=H3SE59_9BACL|nr:hypothetical protein [Paenibacillus dendritiformis]EHQ62735.1 hypothetical protein PDENDC454_09050 [Paenibacillus dendritiformis C454]CAH8769604.1 hypothetical protein H7S4_002335 [Paenibacillus dendritiformis]